MTLTEELAGWAVGLELPDVPRRVVDLAKSQLVSQLAAARGGLSHPLGRALGRAFGPLLGPDPVRSACAFAATTSWLHFDDTAYAGHLSHSTVGVPIAYARALGRDGAALLLAIVVANECAARIAAAATLGEYRGQMAAYTHLAGSVSARLKVQRAPASMWVGALGLAFSLPPLVLRRAFLGSDGKVLSAVTPVRMGLDACDVAATGLRGPADILEHPDGFLARFATLPLPGMVTEGLGRRWHTDTLSFKMRPGGPGVDAAVDCAIALREDAGGVDVDDVAEVVVRAGSYTVAVDEKVAPWLDGADSPVGALTFAIGYTVATALLTGDLRPRDFARPCLEEPERWTLAAKVRVEHDPQMTRRFRLSAIPLGEALRSAGPRLAREWLSAASIADVDDATLSAMASPSETFEHAEKATPARVTLRLVDGRVLERGRDIPLGAAGPDTRRRHAALVRAKFLSTGGDPAVADGLATVEDASPEELSRLVEAALAGVPAADRAVAAATYQRDPPGLYVR